MMSSSKEGSESSIGELKLIRLGDFWFSTRFYAEPEFHSGLQEVEFGENDVLVTSFPKSGTAWLERIVSLIRLDDTQVPVANTQRLDEMSLMLERVGSKVALEQEEPRLIKTHHPYELLPRSFREGRGKEGSESYIGELKLIRLGDFWFSTRFYAEPEFHSGLQEVEFGENDVLVTSFPKSGTAWLERIVSLIRLDDTQVPVANTQRLDEMSLMLERVGSKVALEQEEPRLIKTHHPYELLPRSFREGRGKILYIARNPKDVSVSLYFFRKAGKISNFQGTFEDFFKLFLKGTVTNGPWLQHVKQYWQHRHNGNLKFIFYEDLQKDSPRVIKEIASFLGKDITDEQAGRLATESSFETMKKNPQTNYEWFDKEGLMDTKISKYMRKGVIGDWKNFYSPEMCKDLDEKIEKELSPIGLSFCYE